MLCPLSCHSLSRSTKWWPSYNTSRVDIIVRFLIFLFYVFFTISKWLLSASKRRKKYTHRRRESFPATAACKLSSLTATAVFRTVYARHEGKIYLRENRSEEKSSFYTSWVIEYIRNTNSFYYCRKTCFSSSWLDEILSDDYVLLDPVHIVNRKVNVTFG